jgi:N-succinyl-L-ornithine transcarbamylase
MQQFISVSSAGNVDELVNEALQLKQNPYIHKNLGENKTLGLIFMNPSLRTRLSTQKAALNLGMNVMVMNIDKEGWALEMEDGAVMNGTNVEHIKDAASVMGQYCNIIGIRCFPGLKSKEEDYGEFILKKFIQYCIVPVVSLESGTLHPLQSLADLITIKEHSKKEKPKVVLTWAPHVKALPQAVPNSFSQWMCKSDVEFVITHPKGYELCEDFTEGARIEYNQDIAIKNADFVYIKNWSSYNEYGKVLSNDESWLLNKERLKITNSAKIMHCLPVRRNVEVLDELLDAEESLILKQAANREFAAQVVLKKILEDLLCKL